MRTHEESAETQKIDRGPQSLLGGPSRPFPLSRLRPLTRSSACTSTRYGVLRLLLFFAFCAGVLYLADLAITRGLQSVETGDFGVMNRIVRGDVNAEIVISGSSRAQTHYDPRIIQEITGNTAFNIGRNGSQTDLQLAVLKTYLQHNRKPKLIIHNLDSFSFITSREIYDPGQYIPYLRESHLIAAIRRVYPDTWKWRYLPLYAYSAVDMRFAWLVGIKRLVRLNPPETHAQGFTPRDASWTGDFEKFRDENPTGLSFDVEPQGIAYLTELANICKAAEIPLILAYSPVYIEMQALERNRRDIFERFEEIARECGADFWDFSNSRISYFQHFFYNSQHLNATGASLFTNELTERLKPMLQTRGVDRN